MTKTAQDTLFERIGGMTAVNAAVDLFYEKVIADDRINAFFESVNMHGQSGKMKTFLAYAFGAPIPYSGKDMRAAHAHMDLNEDHFNAVAENLIATLKELAVPQELIDEVMSVASSTKDDVLGN